MITTKSYYVLSYNPAMPNAPHPHRWRIAILLGAGVLVNYFDRVNLSVSYGVLSREFGLSTIAFGYLLSAYSWSYALCQIPAGALLDRFGVRIVGRASTLIWSLASFASSLSIGMRQFFASRLLLGVGEAPTFPANAKAIGAWFPENERGLATACFDAAAKFASAIGVPIMGLLLFHMGWRWTFAATGLASFAYFLAFTIVYREPPTSESATRETVQSEENVSLEFLLTQRKVVGLAIGSAAYNYCFYLLLTWLPGYLALTMHLNLLQSVWYTSIPWLVATATDLIVGGWLVDALIRHGYDASRVRQSVLIGGTLLGVAIFAAGSATTPRAAVVWISISLGGLAAAAPVGWSVPGLIAPRGGVGRVGGIMNFFSQVAAISAPIITGYVVAITHSFKAAFWLAAIFLAIGIAAYALLLGKIERIELHRP
jgi:ACS family D-galactonate transporter-like MFS transporter